MILARGDYAHTQQDLADWATRSALPSQRFTKLIAPDQFAE